MCVCGQNGSAQLLNPVCIVLRRLGHGKARVDTLYSLEEELNRQVVDSAKLLSMCTAVNVNVVADRMLGTATEGCNHPLGLAPGILCSCTLLS